MSVDLSSAAIERRLRQASQLAGSLRPEERLSTKVDLRPAAIASRLREAAQLTALCRLLAAAGRPHQGG